MDKELNRTNEAIDDVISPEDLKIITDGMSWKPNYITSDGRVFEGSPQFGGREIKPLTNDSQMVEIQAKLIESGFLLDGCHIEDECKYMMWSSAEKVYKGKTINLAVCRAAVDYFKGKM